MGVKDLWQVLEPICERKSLWELQDKIIAIDLSCWVCDSQNVGEYSSQPNMYLRNLFFRTSTLLLLGAVPIFVLDGVAPEMKGAVMEQRNAARGFTQSQKTQPAKKRNRSQLKSIQKKCCELLKCLGVKCIQSDGEAEALCALLNKNGLVAGCISQDSDCFLYGAKTVYRNFTITGNSSTGGPGFSIDSYSMASIEECFGLTRNKLIALSLLCGCDYLQQGVAGVGKESALKFLSSVDDDGILDRLRQWREDEYYIYLELERSAGGCEQCGHIGGKKSHLKEGCQDCQVRKGCKPSYNPKSLCQMESERKKTVITELTIRKKALSDPDFPSELVIEEFLKPNIEVPSKLDTKWDQPNILKFLSLAVRFLNWDEFYAFNKFLPVFTRWVIVANAKKQEGEQDSCPVFPEEIKKSRVLRGIPSYEIKWADTSGLFNTLAKTNQDSESDTAGMFCTIEPKILVEKAYPDLVHKYTTQIEEAKKAKRKGKSKSKKNTEQRDDSDKKRCEVCAGCEGCLCRFTLLESKSKPKSKVSKKLPPKDKTDSKQTSLSPFIQKSENKKATSHAMALEEYFETSLVLDQDYDEADLSAIVMEIVGKEAYYQDLSATSPQRADTIHQLSSSSEDEFENYVPLIERIKMKTDQKTGSSPECKKARKNIDLTDHPYSPLAGKFCVDDLHPPPNKRKSVLGSEAAKHFSASFLAFSGGKPAPLETSLESNSDDRFDLGMTHFLNSYEQ